MYQFNWPTASFKKLAPAARRLPREPSHDTCKFAAPEKNSGNPATDEDQSCRQHRPKTIIIDDRKRKSDKFRNIWRAGRRRRLRWGPHWVLVFHLRLVWYSCPPLGERCARVVEPATYPGPRHSEKVWMKAGTGPDTGPLGASTPPHRDGEPPSEEASGGSADAAPDQYRQAWPTFFGNYRGPGVAKTGRRNVNRRKGNARLGGRVGPTCRRVASVPTAHKKSKGNRKAQGRTREDRSGAKKTTEFTAFWVNYESF
jgi:hypothetical protein